MVDNLLDLMTGGDHRRTKRVLEDRKRLREEEERIRQLMEPSAVPTQPPPVQVDFRSLRSLTDLGIDTGFLDPIGMWNKIPQYERDRIVGSSYGSEWK